MLILEKMLVLKTISFFHYIPDEILLAVAEIAKEQKVQAGDDIIKKGDFGDEMFIIVEGRVRVHGDGVTLAELQDREVFGELGALTLEKRTATVTALEETLLLTITYDVLYELIDTYSGLAKGIIQFLCERSQEITKSQIE